jgi:membrane protease YdiL (CAAX protease family)
MRLFGCIKKFFNSKSEKDIATYFTAIIITSLIIYKLIDIFYLPEIMRLGFGLISGFLVGNVLFFISSFICNGSPPQVALELGRLLKFMPGFLLRHKGVLVKYINVALIEEVFWRLFIQKGFFNQLWGVVAITLVFTLIHFLEMKSTILPILEFFLFFLALSLLYKYTDNLCLAVTIHAIRNIYITGRAALKETDKMAMYRKSLLKQQNLSNSIDTGN